jgi:hopene-associated glycosyltransferase HpnB
VVVVDDGSDDGTAAVALQAGASACAAGTAGSRVKVIPAPPLPPGWTGKLWAQSQGLAWIRALPEPPDFVLLTDADIAYETGVLESLVRRAERDGLVLSSRMARLPCDSPAERFFIPAFIFFFQMVYPFSRVNDRRWRTAAAAGGCMLVRWRALEAAGGLAAIRREIIDDCALARRLKPLGPIRLVLSRRVKSLRRYSSSRVIREMIMRSAYAQLGFSPALLAGTVLAMGVAFVAPPLLAVAAGGAVAALGAGAWGMMALAFRPTLRFYGRTPWGGVLLPVIALVYLAFTVQSAFLYAQGRGGLWKGRTYNHSSEP